MDRPSTSKAIEIPPESVPQLNTSVFTSSNIVSKTIKKLPINLYGIVRFFIKDLLKYRKQDKYFIVKDIPFIYIEICGVIVDKQIIRNNISIKVHDGSGQINCLIDQNYFSKIPKLPSFYDNRLQMKNPISDAAKMILSNLNHLHSKIVREQDLTLGKTIILQGKMSDYGGALYVFVQKINLRTTAQYVEYLQTGLKWYENLP